MTPKQKELRDMKVNNLKNRIEEKNALIERVKNKHAEEVARLEQERDDMAILQEALEKLK